MKDSAAKQAGLTSKRYQFALYPTAEQEAALLVQATLVRRLQNCLLAICFNAHARKVKSTLSWGAIDEASASIGIVAGLTGAPASITPQLFAGIPIIDWDEPFRLPTNYDMSRWITKIRQRDKRYEALSTFTPRRVADSVYKSWKAFFRNLKENPALAGRPRFKRADDIWIPYIHLKRAGDIGSSGSGCLLENRGGRNWRLDLKSVPGRIYARGFLPGLARSTARGNAARCEYYDQSNGRFIDADVKRIAGKWWLSICTHVERKRHHGIRHLDIELGVIDGFARVNGQLDYGPTIPGSLQLAQDLAERADALKAARDQRWTKRAPLDPEWRQANDEIARLQRHAANVRNNALHVWTTRCVAEAASIKVTIPEVRKATKTPRGNTSHWGANVETVSTLNRSALSMAPYMTAQMLEYKAEEAGIPCEIVRTEKSAIAIGADIVKSGRALRRARRKIKKEMKDAA